MENRLPWKRSRSRTNTCRGKKLLHWLYYQKHVGAIRAKQVVYKTWNLIFIIRFYRRIFSPMKKKIQ